MAITADLNNTSLAGSVLPFPVAASTIVYLNEHCGVNSSGYLVPMANTAGLVYMGYSCLHADNSAGSNGTISDNVQLAGFGADSSLWVFTTASATQGWVGSLVYYNTDAQTVAQSASNSIVCGLVTQYLSATQIVVNVARRSAT